MHSSYLEGLFINTGILKVIEKVANFRDKTLLCDVSRYTHHFLLFSKKLLYFPFLLLEK